MFPAKFG